MTGARKIARLIPHLLGWGALVLVIFLQNDPGDWDAREIHTLVLFFCSMGIAAYVNLYWLIPRYLFKKKYRLYAGSVLVLVTATALVSTWVIMDIDHMDWFPRLVVMLINVVFFLLLTSGGKLLFEYLRKMMQIKEIENKQLKDELALLKAQVHPHFLFNTLNNLYGLITQGQDREASEITLKLADLMRYLLESSKEDKVSLYREIRFLEDYLALERIRSSNHAEITIEVCGLDREIFIAPLLFIPLVENAFKHGLQTVSEVNYAHFSLAVQGEDLFFEAKNSVGSRQEDPSLSGTGLSNLRKRLQLIYPEKHQLVIESTETSFKVTLHIQL